MALPSGIFNFTVPGDTPLTIRQGDTWSVIFEVTINGVAADLSSSVTAALKIKSTYGGTTLATATCTIPVGTDGKVHATLSAATTAALTVSGTSRLRQLGVWDLQLTDGTDIVTVIGGEALLYMEVTT